VTGGEALATGNLGIASSPGRHAEAREHHERHLALAREIGDVDGEAAATINLALSSGRSPHREAREHQERVSLSLVSAAIDAGRPTPRGTWHRSVDRSHHRGAGARERWLALAREVGDRQGEVRATGNLGVVFYSLGAMRGAGAPRRCLALAREIGSRQGEANATGNLGNVFQSLGR